MKHIWCTVLIGLTLPTACSSPPPRAAGGDEQDALQEDVSDPRAEGGLLLQRIVEAAGGADRLRRIAALEAELEATLHRPDGSTDASARVLIAPPDRMRRTNVIEGMGSMEYVVAGHDVWFRSFGADELEAATGEVATFFRAGLWRDLPVLLLAAARGEIEAERLPPTAAGGAAVEVLEIIPPDDLPRYQLHVDAETMRPLKRVFADDGATVVDEFSDWRVVSGVTLPFRVESRVDDRLSEEISYGRIVVDPALAADAFEPGP